MIFIDFIKEKAIACWSPKNNWRSMSLLSLICDLWILVLWPCVSLMAPLKVNSNRITWMVAGAWRTRLGIPIMWKVNLGKLSSSLVHGKVISCISLSFATVVNSPILRKLQPSIATCLTVALLTVRFYQQFYS